MPVPAAPADGRPEASLRDQLRAATAAAHARVDAAMPLARPDVTLVDYQRHLLILDDWLAALARLMTQELWLADERRAVARDAAQCLSLCGTAGEPRLPSTDAPQRLRAALAGPHGAAARWGVRYVVEGSHLGGQVLHRRLAAALAPHPLGYLARGTAEGGWRQVLQALAGPGWDAPARAAAIDAAQGSFELLIACLDARAELLEPQPS